MNIESGSWALRCSRTEDLLIQSQYETLSDGLTDDVSQHLAICPECTAFSAMIQQLPDRLLGACGTVPEPKSSIPSTVKHRMGEIQAGLREQKLNNRRRSFLASGWMGNAFRRVPAYQAALGVAALILVLLAGDNAVLRSGVGASKTAISASVTDSTVVYRTYPVPSTVSRDSLGRAMASSRDSLAASGSSVLYDSLAVTPGIQRL